jgi:hypothetical protein
LEVKITGSIVLYKSDDTVRQAISSFLNTSLPVKDPAPVKASEFFVPIGKDGAKISILDLSEIKVKDYEAISGIHMKTSEKVGFKMMQKQIRNSIKTDGTFDSKKLEKLAQKAKRATEQSRKYLRIWLLLLAAAIILTILGLFVPFLWIIGAIAGLGATVFFILWIIALAG